MFKRIIGKNKNKIMYYSRLLERREKTESIDILHFKIASGMKKLLIFNCLRHVAKHGQCLIGNNFIKYQDRLTNNMSFSSVSSVLSNGTCHSSQIAANTKIEQENKHFSKKNHIF